MKAQAIMTREVATVRPETSVREIAALMMEKNISGVPVVHQLERCFSEWWVAMPRYAQSTKLRRSSSSWVSRH
jgi:CBS-domain-containing membrane protein